MSVWIHILKQWKWPWRTESLYSWRHWVSEEITSGILFCQTAYLWTPYSWMWNRRWSLRKGKLVSWKDYKRFCVWYIYTLIHFSKYVYICKQHRLVGSFHCLYSLWVHLVFLRFLALLFRRPVLLVLTCWSFAHGPVPHSLHTLEHLGMNPLFLLFWNVLMT